MPGRAGSVQRRAVAGEHSAAADEPAGRDPAEPSHDLVDPAGDGQHGARVDVGEAVSDDAWRVEPHERREHLELVDSSGQRSRLRVVGLSDWNWLVGAGLYVSAELPGSLLLPTPPPVDRHFVAPAPGVSATQLAARLNTAYASRGVQAQAIPDEITAQNSVLTEFITILQSYLALGMFVGIVGLTVALVRGAREQRSQLGVLRALGFPGRVLRDTLLVESMLVCVEGILIGVGLGVFTAWQVLINSTVIARNLSFAIPWVFVAVLAVSALGAALLASLVPARKAGRVPVAESLRPSP